MQRKLLVITAGTLAAGVGIEFLRQVEAHQASELQVIVRYIDTAYLSTRYAHLRSGEWFQMTIDRQYMDNIRRNLKIYPDFNDLLYPGLLPTTTGVGSGSIRYNAAGAIVINHERIKQWLTTSITTLARSGGRQKDLSIALVVSSVGATGSGTLERLVDIIVDCAQTVGIPSPLHLDIFILQPGMQGVTDLGLSNTLALYAEMAATRLSQNNVSIQSYRGRTIMVGWGSQSLMASIDQLQEAAATLVRMTHDPCTGIAVEFQEREVDNHVLREQDIQTGLPSHLSSATAITISLGDLEVKIIQRDATRLIDMLVFGGKPSETTTGEYFTPEVDLAVSQIGSLLSSRISFLQGETPEDRYGHLVERLTEDLSLPSLRITATQLKGIPPQQQANQLRRQWQVDKEEIARRVRQKIQEQGTALARTAFNDIIRSRREAIATGLSLRDLLDEYRHMENILISTLAVQQESSQKATNDNEVIHKLSGLERALWGKERTLRQALGAIQANLRQTLQRESHTVAIEVLKVLQSHCAESRHALEIVLQRLLRQRKSHPMWAAADQGFRTEMDHPLHMAALSTPEETTRYADWISIFPPPNRKRVARGANGGIVAAEDQAVDQLADFRKWLDYQEKLDALFNWEIDILLGLAQDYAREHVHTEFRQHSVVDVLLQTGEGIPLERLREAASKAHSLVSFSAQFAGELREARHVSAYYKDEEQRGILQKAIDEAFGQGQCTLLSSKDPSEIAIFYYVDGLPMSAVTDLTGRCLDAFLRRRLAWNRQSQLKGSSSETTVFYQQRVGVPVYSGKDAEQRVIETGVIRRLYSVKDSIVDDYSLEEMPELGTASELKEWSQDAEILIDLENRTDISFEKAIHAIQSLYQSSLHDLEDGQEALQVLLALTQIMLFNPSGQRLQEAFHSLGSRLEPLVMLASMSYSASKILGLAEILRRRCGGSALSTKYLLWGIYQNADDEIREMLTSMVGDRQLNALMNEWLGISDEANNLIPASSAAFLKAPKTKNCLLIIDAAIHMAGDGELVDERRLFAGLLSVPEASAVKWMTKTLGISTGQLLEIVTRPSSNEGAKISARQIRLYRSQGDVFWKLDRYQEALTAYEQAISLAPSDAGLYRSQGDVFWKLDRYQEALTAYEQAISLAPSDAGLYRSQGDVFWKLDRYQEALAAYEQAIHLAPSDSLAYYGKGNILFALKHYEEALVAYERAILLDPSHYPRAYYNKGVILEDFNRYEEALTAYEQAIHLDPKIEAGNVNAAQSARSLRVRVKLVQQFLVNVGFDLRSTATPLGFFAVASEAIWRKRFSRGVYIRILFGASLDYSTVQSIYHDAQKYCDCTFVVIDQQPTISGWMAIGGLRAEEKDGCVFLPIAESLIKEETDASKQSLVLSAYVDERLGKDFDPYDVRDPVSDAVSFFGREGVTDEILKALRRGQRVGLFGLQKIGKSSVLKRLQKKSELPTAYVYLIKGDSLISIYRRILEAWAIDTRVKYPGLEWFAPTFTMDSDPTSIFDSSAKDLLMLLRSVTTVPLLAIFFDEIENIIPYDERDRASLDRYMTLMDSLRGLQQETGGLSLLIAGLYPDLARRNYFWGKQKNPMYQVISERFLPPLEKEDCAFMIRSLGSQINLKYDDASIDFILSMSGAHPFLARQLCSFAYKRRHEMHTVSLQDVQKAAWDFVRHEDTASYFNDKGLWGELSKLHIWGEDISAMHHKVLMALAASSAGLTSAELCFDAHKITVEQSIAALRERGIIALVDSSQRYQIAFGLLRDWIRWHLLGVEY